MLSEPSFLISTTEISSLYEVVVRFTRDKVGFDKWKPMFNIGLQVSSVVLNDFIY